MPDLLASALSRPENFTPATRDCPLADLPTRLRGTAHVDSQDGHAELASGGGGTSRTWGLSPRGATGQISSSRSQMAVTVARLVSRL